MDGDKNLTCFTGYRWNMICWNFSQTRIDFQMNFNFRFPFVVKQNFNTNNSYLFHGFYKKCLIFWVFLLFTYCQIILKELFLDLACNVIPKSVNMYLSKYVFNIVFFIGNLILSFVTKENQRHTKILKSK